MIKNRIYIIASLVLIITGILTGNSGRVLAQDNTLMFLGIYPQSNQLNPAFSNSYSSATLSLSVQSFLGNSSLTLNDLFETRVENGASYKYWDFATINNQLNDKNYIQFGAATTPVSLGLRVNKNNFFNFSFSLKHHSFLQFPGTLGSLHLGNADIENNTTRTIDLNNYKLSEVSYAEYSFGYVRELFSGFEVGIHIKALTGFSAIKTNHFKASVETSDDFSFSTLKTDINIDVSESIMEFDESSHTIEQGTGLIDFFTGKESPFMRNRGLAADIGFNWESPIGLNLYGSLNNMGFINWGYNPQRMISRGEYLYDGLSFSPYDLAEEGISFNEYLQQYGDTIVETLFPESDSKSFQTRLPRAMRLGASFPLCSRLSVHALYKATYITGEQLREGTLGTTYRAFPHFSFAASLSYSNYWWNNIGLGLFIDYDRFRFYLVSDNVNTVLRIRNNREINVSFGINLKIWSYEPGKAMF